MEFKEDSLLHLKNLIKALDIAKYPDLKGQDIVAFYRMFVWISELQKKAIKEVEESKALASIKIIKQKHKSPIKEFKKQPKKSKGKK